MRLNIGEMTFGDILNRGASLLFARLGIFFVIELIVLAPTLILTLALPDLAVNGGGVFLVVLPSIVLGPIGSAALLRVITEEFQGRSVGLGDAFSFAFSRFLPLFRTSILSGLGIMLGMVLCIIPGIYFAICWALMSQVVVVENLSGNRALNRSAELVKGHFGRVFGILFLIGLGIGAVTSAFEFGLSELLPHTELGPPPPNAIIIGPAPLHVNNYVNFVVVQTLPALVNILGQMFTAICTTLLYFDLRYRKDQFNVYEEDLGFGGGRPSWRDEPGEEPASGENRPGETGIKPGEAGWSPPPTGIRNTEGPQP